MQGVFEPYQPIDEVKKRFAGRNLASHRAIGRGILFVTSPFLSDQPSSLSLPGKLQVGSACLCPVFKLLRAVSRLTLRVSANLNKRFRLTAAAIHKRWNWRLSSPR